MLLQRIRTEATAGRDVPINRQRLVTYRNDLNPRTDGRSIGPFSNEFHREPMVSLTGILEQDIVVFVAGNRAPHLNGNVNVAITVPIAAANAVPFLKMSGTRRGADVDKTSAAEIIEDLQTIESQLKSKR